MGDSSAQQGVTAGALVRSKRARPLRADQLADKYLAKRLKVVQQNKQKRIHSQPVPVLAATHTGSAGVSSAMPSGWALGKHLQQQSQPQHLDVHVQRKTSEPAAPQTADAQAVKHSAVQQHPTSSGNHAHTAVCKAATEQLPVTAVAAAHCGLTSHQCVHPQQQQHQPPAAAHAAPAAPAIGDDSDDAWLQLWDPRLLEQDMGTTLVSPTVRPAGITVAVDTAATATAGITVAADTAATATAGAVMANECAGPADVGTPVCPDAPATGLRPSAACASAGREAEAHSTGSPEQGVLIVQSAALLSPSPSSGKPDQTCLCQHQVQPTMHAASLPGQPSNVQCTKRQNQEQQQHGQQHSPPQPQQQLVHGEPVQQRLTIALHADHVVKALSTEHQNKPSTAAGAHMHNTTSGLIAAAGWAPAASSLQAAAGSTLPHSQQAAPITAAHALSIVHQHHQAGSLASASSPAAAAAASTRRCFSLASLLYAMPELPIKQPPAAGSGDTMSAAVVDQGGCHVSAAPIAAAALVSRAQSRQSTPPAAQALPTPRLCAGYQQRQQQKQKYIASLQAAGVKQCPVDVGAASMSAPAAVACTAAAVDVDGSSSEEGEVAAGSNGDCMTADACDDVACNAQGHAAAVAAADVSRKRKKSRGGRQVRQRQQRAAADQAAAGEGCVAGSAQGLYAEIKQWEKENNKGRKAKVVSVGL